jgi:hypothetical protein
MGISSSLTKNVTTYNQLVVVNHSSPIFYIPIWVSKTIEDVGAMLVIFFVNNKLKDERNI